MKGYSARKIFSGEEIAILELVALFHTARTSRSARQA